MRSCLLIIVLTILCQSLFGQDNDNQKKSDKIYFGGNLGLNFGDITYIEISPLIGYKFNDNYSAGLSFTYRYFKDKRFEVSGNVLGGSIFNRYNVTDELFLIAEYQMLSYSSLNSSFSENENSRITIPYLWVGGGYNYRLGNRSAIFISFVYDLIQDIDGRIQNPQIRGGVTFGI